MINEEDCRKVFFAGFIVLAVAVRHEQVLDFQ
jgi:hypothetical protein